MHCKRNERDQQLLRERRWRFSVSPAEATEYRTVAHLFGIGKTIAHRIAREFCDAVSSHLFLQIKKPTGRELQKIIESFEHICGLPQVAGAIDGTHIEITAPTDCPEDYVNRKGYHSLQVQALVNSSIRFTDIFAEYPGSVHDTRVFRIVLCIKLAEREYKLAEREGGVFPEVPTV